MVPHQPVHEVERLRLDHELRVLGREALGHHARVRPLVVIRCPAKPIEKVFTRPPAASAISATTVEESRPPERKAPSGTSATSRRSTAGRSSARKRSSASASVGPASEPRAGPA